MSSMIGTWTARAVEGKLGYTSTGKEQVAVALEVTEGAAAGQTITWFGYFTDKTEARTIESLRNAGWQGDDLSDLSSLGSCDCQIVVEAEEDQNGTPRDRVRWINRSGRVALKSEMAPQDAKAFAARMRSLASSIRPIATTSAPARPKPQPTPHETQKANAYVHDPAAGDDIPF